MILYSLGHVILQYTIVDILMYLMQYKTLISFWWQLNVIKKLIIQTIVFRDTNSTQFVFIIT